MRRRPVRRGPLPPGDEEQALPEEGPVANDDPEVAVDTTRWEAWEESEAERVAEWLKSKTGIDGRNGDGEEEDEIDLTNANPPFVMRRPVRAPSGGEPPVASVRSAAPTLEELHEQRELLESTVGAVQEVIDEEARRAAADYEAVEAEVRTLEQRNAALSSQLAIQRAEADRLAAEQRLVRDRLQAEVTDLHARCRGLAAQVEQARPAVAAEQDSLQVEGDRLRAEIERLRQEGADLAAAAEAATRDEELARLDAEAENARLAVEAERLAEQRARLAAELEATSEQVEEARRAREDVRARRLAEIDGERAATRSMVSSVAAAQQQLAATRRTTDFDPTGQLAATMAELGRRYAEVLEEDQADAAPSEMEAAEVETTPVQEAGQEAGTPDPGPRHAKASRGLFRRRK